MSPSGLLAKSPHGSVTPTRAYGSCGLPSQRQRNTNLQVGMTARTGWSILVRQTNRQPVGCPWVRKVSQPCLPGPSYAVICRPAAGCLNGPDSGVGIVVNMSVLP
ncbi:uncharacterized protein PGTG_21959 [Puccinia graminis f. sp. tritici CRL 75-36-700-3]|uniref:Uncharacterized protein n=1 Tax=Puccinia graminis f. sp. tritici (strain CRL 75-36-700-3 / race SCCL) TaxID=418459 RepID=H6QSZ0_PUCGT|nr:uncharacterized protein PGTG_21959 [Puccinia graminis f. sp. tritici CRL 75-36-700-3]EHS63943.1 hypothetical protein PGTG_21959 [Puccinia graminis f. sp. tritici CRL 75-36-700-3]